MVVLKSTLQAVLVTFLQEHHFNLKEHLADKTPN